LSAKISWEGEDGAVNNIPASPGAASVYQRVLGAHFDDLHPQLQNYLGQPAEGTVGFGEGTFDVAGSRRRWLRPVFAVMAPKRILFPEFARDVPFTITTVPGPGEGLSAGREFHFPGTTRQIEDTMHVIDGELHDFMGRSRALEVRLTARVVDGGLSMISDAAWIHLGRLRVPLPAIFGAKVVLSQRWTGDAHRIEVHLSNPVLGDIFEYAGHFTHRWE
jgi:hypothetical protein